MEIVVNIVTSKLWVLGNSRVSFGGHYWTFFYCIEGVNTKAFHIIFYNADLNRMYLRSSIIDLKINNVILQKCKYVSNVFKLLIEWKCNEGLVLWNTKDMNVVDNTAITGFLKTGIISRSDKETYFCAPSITFRDTFIPLKLEKSHHARIINDSLTTDDSITSAAGYVMYKGKTDHTTHFNKTWIPQVTVDSVTFQCSFEIVFDSPRIQGECLECIISQDDSFSSAVSNLLINH